MTTQLPNYNPIRELTETRRSPIHGLGVFAAVDIPAGEEICENYLAFDDCPWANFHEDL